MTGDASLTENTNSQKQGFSRPNTADRRPPMVEDRNIGNSLPNRRLENRQAPAQRPQQGFSRPGTSERRPTMIDRRSSEGPSRSFNRGAVSPGATREFNRNPAPRMNRTDIMRMGRN